MRKRVTYIGIDYFRVIAAYLVITIHTSPLSSVNGTADFMLTRIIARVAVPFFFMASGFFLFPKTEAAELRPDKRMAFLKKTAILYAIAILTYLPLNMISGTTKEWEHLPNLLKDLFFDGTFYHLWYLPAAIIGATITWILLSKLKTGQAFAVSLFLYIIGLFGDSYYGIADKIPVAKGFYSVLFQFSDYTRNGLFFAPVFFMLGALLARKSKRYQIKLYLIGLSVSVVLMLAEGLILHGFGVQRHDSMYIMLIPSMVFLFQILLSWKGGNLKSLRNLSLFIYLIHPAIIVVVRGLAKVTRLQWLLIDNSVVHFLAVSIGSFAAAVMLIMLLNVRYTQKFAYKQGRTDRAWAEINMSNLNHNVQTLRKALPDDCEIMAVVKANAYGHGDVKVSHYLNNMGIHAFAVATIDEGIHLRKNGIKGEILVLGYTAPQRASELFRYRLSQTVVDAEHAEGLNRFGKPLQVHIKVDTGMHRLGENYNHVSEITYIFRCKNLRINGIFTHLCVSDSMEPDNVAFTKTQIENFYRLLENLSQQQITLPKIHIQSSYGVLNYPELQCDYARVGIALYGVLSNSDQQTKLSLDLRPVLELKSKIALIKTIKAGECVGYGRQFVAEKNTTMAILPIGYADGLPRNLSCNNGMVLLHGRKIPIIGGICMDQLMIDVTGIADVQRGDVAILIGKDGTEEITAEEVAEEAGTITNELLSRLRCRTTGQKSGSRLQRQ